MSKSELDKAILKIVGSTRLFTKVEHCYGEFRFRIVDGQLVGPNIAMKIYGILSAILIIIGYLSLLLCLWFDIKLDIFDFDIDKCVFIKASLMTVSMLQYIIGLGNSLRNDKENINILMSLAHIDCSLKIVNNKVFYEKSRKYNRIVIFVFCIMVINGLVKYFLENDSFVLFIVVYNVVDALADNKYDLEALAFYVYIKMLSDRLEILNKYLEQFVLNKDISRSLIIYKDINTSDRECYVGHISQENTEIASLAAIFENLGETLSLINNLFSCNIFVYLASIFIYITLTLWSFVNIIRSKKNITFLLGIIFECVEVISIVVVMCYICEAFTLKRQSTKILVNEIIMDYKLPKEMRIQAKTFMDLIDAWPLQVHACSMFCFNIQLLINFIGLSTSYLIVFIQATN